MGSNYAYVYYKKDVKDGDVTATGKIVNLTHSSFAGQLDLVSPSELQRLEREFPDCVEGKVIEEDNILNMVKMCYDKLKQELGEVENIQDDEVRQYLEYIENEFVRGGVLKPDGNSPRAIQDLASKYMNLQWKTRNMQSEHTEQKSVNK